MDSGPIISMAGNHCNPTILFLLWTSFDLILGDFRIKELYKDRKQSNNDTVEEI